MDLNKSGELGPSGEDRALAEQVLQELAQVRWQTLTTELGILIVQPLNMKVLKIYSDCFTINRVEHRLHGPLYRDGRRWTAFKPGRVYGQDPDFTLLRCDNMSRQGSHTAYRKAVQIIESAVNSWAPSEREVARLAVASIRGQIAEQRAHLAMRRNTGWDLKFPTLFAGLEESLQSTVRDLKCAQAVLNGGDVQALLKPPTANRLDDSDGRQHAGN